MTSSPERPSTSVTSGLYRCLHCHSPHLRPNDTGYHCPACGHQYPTCGGVPLLAKEFDISPSGFTLPANVADKLCQLLSIPADNDNRDRLSDILSRQYRIGGFQQTAENNYFLNRVIVDETQKRPPLRAQFADRPVNADVLYSVDLHHIPPELTAGEAVSYNVRLTNTGRSVISSAVAPAVRLNCVWRDSGGRAVEGVPNKLPIELSPGQSMSVPLFLNVPADPGRYELEVLLWHDQTGGLRDGGARLLVAASPVPRPRPWDEWKPTGVHHGGYDGDHIAAIALLRQAVGENPPPGTRILELGGCCNPMTIGLPADVYSLDIDMQTLQVGRLLADRRGDRVSYLCADANDLPFADGSFDWVTMFSTLHHFAEPAAVLASIPRVLRPNGRIAVLCEPLGHYNQGEMYQGFLDELAQGINEQSFTLEEYHAMFRRAGLEAEQVVVDVGSFKAILRPLTKP